MKRIVKIFLFSFIAVFFIFIIYVLYTAKETDYNNTIPIARNCENLDSKFDFEAVLKKLDLSELRAVFPYDTYLEFENYCDAEAIKRSLEKLNTINVNKEDSNRDILIHTLTNKLEAKIETRFQEFNADSLIMLLQWIDEFKTYEKIDTKNGALYGIIYEHWMGFISNRLGVYYNDNPFIRFDFKFKYLQSVCQSKRFAPAVGQSNLEKVVEYTLNQEYTYLFNRFWNGTNIFVKLIFVLLFSIFIYMLYCTYQYSFKK